MTHAGIECFLAVCRHKTGTAAAQALYITQPSLSARLANLERELGGPLFYRKKGCREMPLTPAGKEFYKLAVQYEALMEQMQNVCRNQSGVLRVSAFNSLATYLLPGVCERFLQEHPNIGLELQDMELEAASRSILAGETDIAFTAGKVSDTRLVQTPVFSESMVLICSMDTRYEEPVSREQLSAQREVYIPWSNDFDHWHRRTLGFVQPQLQVSIMAHLRRFLNRQSCWAIVPISVAQGLMEEGCARMVKTDLPLPGREISCLRAADRVNHPAVEAFSACLRSVLSAYPEIRLL